jgi:uncharacterized protein YndB with AHSA1/START domain
MFAKSHDRTLTFDARGERELVMRRVFRASKAAVFDAWTKPALLRQWFGPPSWSLTQCDVDLRVGGAWHYVMEKDSVARMEMRGTFREIVANEPIVTTEAFVPAWFDGDAINTLTLTEKSGLTTLEVVVLYASRAIRDGVLASNARGGADASYDRLETLMGGAGTVDVTRTFDASIEQVWNAWTKDELVKRWWGPHGFTCPAARLDVRVGASSLVAMRPPGALAAQDMYSTWTYEDVLPMSRLSYRFNLSDAMGAVLDPSSIGLPRDFPRDARHVVTLTAQAPNRTEMHMVEEGYLSDQLRDLSRRGLDECLDKMAALFVSASTAGSVP